MEKLGAFFTEPTTGIGLFIAVLVSRMAAFTGDQMTVQRFQTTRSIRDEKRAFIINGLGDSIWMIGLGFVGVALFAYIQYHPLPPEVGPDQAFPHFMGQVFPTGIIGLVIAAIFAASLSSIDSALNSSSSVFVADLHNRLFLRREVSSKSDNRQSAVGENPKSEIPNPKLR